MSITLGIVMDPIQTIKPHKDSSLGLLLAAQQQGWSLVYMEMKDLMLDQEVPKALMCPLKVWDSPHHWFELKNPSIRALSDLSVIMIRKDPPVDSAYLHALQILEKANQNRVPVINNPSSLLHYNEKLLALCFPEYVPPTLVTQSLDQAHQFVLDHRDVIVKPLDGMGGESVFRIQKGDPNQQVIFETLSKRQEGYFLVQRYIPEIQAGDKRIILIDGQPMPYGLARLPKSGETRANLARGGKGIAVPLNEKDLEICHQVGPFVKEKGLLWVGLDVIGPYLTEVNITSPTCVREIEAQTNININAQLIKCILHHINPTP